MNEMLTNRSSRIYHTDTIMLYLNPRLEESFRKHNVPDVFKDSIRDAAMKNFHVYPKGNITHRAAKLSLDQFVSNQFDNLINKAGSKGITHNNRNMLL